jgi:hypothetical protein
VLARGDERPVKEFEASRREFAMHSVAQRKRIRRLMVPIETISTTPCFNTSDTQYAAS